MTGHPLHDKALAALDRQDIAAACRWARAFAQAEPDNADAAAVFGFALAQAGDIEGAIAEWQRLVRLQPDNADAWYDLGWALSALDREATAEMAYHHAIKAMPGHRGSLFNLGNMIQRRGNLVWAGQLFQQLTVAHPDFAPGWMNLGRVLKRRGDLAGAERAYREGLRIDPGNVEIRWNLSHVLLIQGRWREGFTEFEARHALPNAPQPPWPTPSWTTVGPLLSASPRRILLWSDQGHGDSLLFLRFAKPLAAAGHHVMVAVQDALSILAARTEGIAEVLPYAQRNPGADIEVGLSSLPNALELNDGAPVWDGPYIKAPTANLPRRWPAAKAVGLVWAGNPTFPGDATRSLPFDSVRPLLDLPGYEWYSLQIGAAAEAARDVPPDRLHSLAPRLASFGHTASAIAALDLVVTSDTAVANLAGAMGKDAIVLLQRPDCDWRWEVDGPSTPWFPTLRLRRQRKSGDWAGLIADICQEMQRS